MRLDLGDKTCENAGMDSAYLTLFAFFATDEFDGVRRELLESGVSVRRIQVLYPLDFSSVADTLRAYLARNGQVHTFKKDDAGAFESADEALWNSLDGNEKNRVLAEISVILNDEEIKHDLRVSHNTTSRRGDDTLVSQVNNDYHSLRYAMGYLMYGSSIREAAGKHLLDLAFSFLPDLRVATLATEQELDASACWSLLATAISPDFAARGRAAGLKGARAHGGLTLPAGLRALHRRQLGPAPASRS